MKKKWYQGEIGEDLPITVVAVVAEMLIIAGLFAYTLWVYR